MSDTVECRYVWYCRM